MTFRHLIIVLSALVLSAHCATADDLSQEVKAATLVSLYGKAPDFTCRTTDGREFQLSAMRGKVVLLYFFASSVPFSLTEMRYIEKEVFEKLRQRDDFAILGVARGHTREETVVMGGQNKLTFPLAADPKQELYGRYFTKFVPRTVVVRKNGTIAYLASGSKEYESIVQLQTVLARELAATVP
ncbi:peroxiredoxin family protein [Prosthecobacter sp.]|uniref:peroxiredoxin family protein n=1 Tax=Prosthecobacter sp. TaxID=1965333 RepID=UPI0037832E5F